jgi:gamma-glutamyltranspeptidase/glutathione hydrolase
MRSLQRPGRSPVLAPEGMASTSNPLSTQAAVTVLQNGGNAMDAAIAACAVQGVVEPESTGIGGDCFCLYSEAGSDKVIAMNGSGRAPMGLTADWLLEQGISEIPQQSPHAVTVPTAIDAWVQLNRDYGSKPLGDLLQPAIGYARNGFPIGQRVAADFAASHDLLTGDPDISALYLKDGEDYKFGDRFTNPNLAKTMEAIAENGRDGFYKGWVAADILAKLQSLGGHHVQADFDAAVANYVTPIKTNFRGYDIWECPPNGQGVIALMLLNIMSGIDTFGDHPISVARMHHEIEAGRLAYRDRNLYLADPTFSDVPVEAMLSADHAAAIRAQINPDRALDDLPETTLPPHKSTVYISVVDKDRNACSFINTVFHNFGAGILAPKSGVILQNRGQGFVVKPGHPNCIEPGKRPLHTIIPGMATKDGKTVMSFGVMGGEYQAFGHMQFLTRLFDYGMDVQEAQDMPRFFPDPFSDVVEVEEPITDEMRDALRALGHNIQPAHKPIGGSQAIFIDWDTNLLMAGSDPRKDGCAMGY